MIDVEKLAREADCTHVNLSGDMAMATERLSRFAALVLEQAAQKCDEKAKRVLAAQSGAPDLLSNVMLRQIAIAGHQADAESIRAMKPEAK